MRYYFHATDGYEFVIDRTGRRLGAGDLHEVAAEVAASVRHRLGLLADLADWLVVVQDSDGRQVEVLAFEALPEWHAAAAAA